MKKILCTVFFIVFVVSSSIFADRKSEATVKVEIENASKKIKKIERDSSIKEFLPYTFADAKLALKNAKIQLDDGEEDWASFYAQKALILANTSLFKAKTRLAKWSLMKEEKFYWKSIATSDEKDKDYQKKIAKLQEELFEIKLKFIIADAGLVKTGAVYTAVLEDRNIFIRRTLSMSPSGEKSLKKISQVFSIAPSVQVMIEGHTYRRDRNNSKSSSKANAVKDYLIKNGASMSQINVTAYGNKKPLVVNGRRKRGRVNDRVVIVIEFPKQKK